MNIFTFIVFCIDVPVSKEFDPDQNANLIRVHTVFQCPFYGYQNMKGLTGVILW